MLQLGQELQIPTGPPPTPALLPLPFESIQLSEPVIIQGRSLVIRVKLSQSLALRGDIDGRPLYFVGDGPEKWTVTSIHALARSNQYPITLIATLPDGREVPTYQSVTVVDGPYGTETIELDEERASLLDPDISMQEWERLVEIWSQVTPQPLWSGSFYYPVDYPSVYITSDFGTRRSYNDGPVTSFHGGTDFGGGTNKAIYAPAAGQVVLAERLNVRGNAVLIDHGLGLFTGYWHQSEIVVQEGQFVQPGDLIGYIGDTGLVTGPHLHWEMRLQGFAVEPLQWVQQAIP
jgi:murein DD-endopeptidase MepM/ murein hydrolase activator NlpD